MELSIDKQKIYYGLGLAFILIVCTGAVMTYRPKPKVDLSKFDSPDLPGSGKCMNPDFIKMLVKLEKESGYPIFEWINRGARSPAHNSKVGGVSSSAHKMPTCRAADIKTATPTIQRRLVAAARKVGFKRIGIGRTFIHLDNDPTKPQNVSWGYPSGTKPPFNPFDMTCTKEGCSF